MRRLVTLVALVAPLPPAFGCNTTVNWVVDRADFKKPPSDTTTTDGTTAMTTDATDTTTQADTSTSTVTASGTTESGTQTETSSDPTQTTGMTTEVPCGDGVCASDEDYIKCSMDCDPICGNGVPEGDGEKCDDGNADNTDACVSCQDAACGDGFVRADEMAEECDDGNLVDGDGCEGTCMLPRRIVFVTSETYQGNMTIMGDAVGKTGLAGADAQCQARATAQGLSGTFKAWLSDGNNNPAARFSAAMSEPKFAGLYVLVDGTTKVADGWLDLIDGSLDHAINMTDTMVTLEAYGWSNASVSGGLLFASKHCTNWTSAAGGVNNKGGIGYSFSTMSDWSESGDSFCSDSRPLFCFED